MPTIAEQALGDLERIFDDWGQPAQLVEIGETYDVQSGRPLTTRYPVDVRVIPGRERSELVGEALARMPLETTVFLLLSATVPETLPLTSARIRFREREYRIQMVTPSRVDGLLVLECQAN